MTGNRVELHAATVRAAIASGQKVDGSGPMEPGALERLDAELAMSAMEVVAFQQAQARAHASGVLSTAEAMTVYRALGGDHGGSPANGGWARGVDLATKVTVTTLMTQLLARR